MQRGGAPPIPPNCFRLTNALDPNRLGLQFVVTLDSAQTEAFAMLVPLLGCGEEAAALAFDGLASAGSDEVAGDMMRAIAAEERVHDALLKCLAQSLPTMDATQVTLRRARRFHIDLGRGGPALHLARIAAIDAAVCMLLSRLLRPGTPLGDDPAVYAVLSRIRSDEARHVRVSRNFVLASGAPWSVREAAAEARAALANILMLGGAAFETLAVDADTLFHEVRRLPNGLLAA